jgi:hypothetical protein
MEKRSQERTRHCSFVLFEDPLKETVGFLMDSFVYKEATKAWKKPTDFK